MVKGPLKRWLEGEDVFDFLATTEESEYEGIIEQYTVWVDKLRISEEGKLRRETKAHLIHGSESIGTLYDVQELHISYPMKLEQGYLMSDYMGSLEISREGNRKMLVRVKKFSTGEHTLSVVRSEEEKR